MAELTELPMTQLLGWCELSKGKFYDWRGRYGRANAHNGQTPRDHWLTPEERQAILDYHERHPLDGYRRLAYMMLDEDIVAASPSSVYRVLQAEGRLDRWNRTVSKKGTGFVQPLKPHDHWHIDIAYINIGGTFYYLCAVLDGCSRYLVHWEIQESMTEADVELVLERAREKFPGVTPRVISDNGPQFIAKDFKLYIRLVGMTHVRTAPYYPQSNGKLERWNRTAKFQLRLTPPASLEEARAIVRRFVEHYNAHRLHSAIRYITPLDRLNGQQDVIWTTRKRKLAEARERRAQRQQDARQSQAAQAC